MFRSRRTADIRVRLKRNPRQIFRKLVLLIITVYVVYLSYGFIHDLLVTRLAKFEQIQQGVIQTSVPVKGILVRNETVVPAPRSGKLKIIIPEGERVRVGQVVAQVVATSLESKSGEKVFNLTAPRAGIANYHMDGLEEVYSPQNIKELDLKKIETLKSVPGETLAGSQVEEGKPVLKIVNNLAPLFIIATTEQVSKLLVKETPMSFLMYFGSDEKDISRITLLEKDFSANHNRMLFSLSNYSEKLMVARTVDFNIITARYEGFVVPARAIVRKDGRDGIYTVYKERVKWKKILICGQVGEKVVVSGVTPDIKVILSPEYVKEGRPFKSP